MAQKELTPLMRQYFEIKNSYPDTLLLFQVGDFYELFFEDAQQAAQFLGIALTQRGTAPNGEPIPLCGVPVHVLDHYLTKLIKGGYKVAICDQLEAPKPGKIVERDVTQVLTPGTLTDTKLLDAKSASYLCVLFPTDSNIALLCVELLTGTISGTHIQSTHQLLEAELGRFLPDEIVVPDSKAGKSLELWLKQQGYNVSVQAYQATLESEAQQWWRQQLSQQDVDERSSQDSLTVRIPSIEFAFTLFYSYFKRTNPKYLENLQQFSYYNPHDFLMLDAATQRNLELVKNTQDGTSAHTLFSILDAAVTPMGSRAIKKWLLRPLLKQDVIEQRLDAISYFIQNNTSRESIRKNLRSISDLERVVGRIALKRAQLHDYTALLQTLALLPELTSILNAHGMGLGGEAVPDESKTASIDSKSNSLLENIIARFTGFEELVLLLQRAINQDTNREWLVHAGFNQELDRLRDLVEHGTQAILALEKKEQLATGINSLKIRFNGAHGYGIEITKANNNLVPAHYMRIQTLVNRERYTTQELKDLEYDLIRSRTDISELEKEIFEGIKKQIEPYLPALKKLSQALAHLDALAALAHIAYTHEYTRPEFTNNRDLVIISGRHSVVEQKIKKQFIANNTELTDNASLWIITGPNMGGKSTYLRQVALISIMAQMGSYVPAQSAQLALVDRIFTRIGAADNVAEGKSTFLVEMEETALICTQATKNSLVILDEVGRGTSTFDGLAIAQAVVEYIYTHIQARCLFATHYHELTALSKQFGNIAPYYAASTQTPDGIVLLHKILPGVADGSFGLEVAKQAQLPTLLLERAQAILVQLTRAEKHQISHAQVITQITTGAAQVEDIKTSSVTRAGQLPLVANATSDQYARVLQRKQELEAYILQQETEREREKYLASQIELLDCEHLTPKQALDFLWKLKENQ